MLAVGRAPRLRQAASPAGDPDRGLRPTPQCRQAPVPRPSALRGLPALSARGVEEGRLPQRDLGQAATALRFEGDVGQGPRRRARVPALASRAPRPARGWAVLVPNRAEGLWAGASDVLSAGKEPLLRPKVVSKWGVPNRGLRVVPPTPGGPLFRASAPAITPATPAGNSCGHVLSLGRSRPLTLSSSGSHPRRERAQGQRARGAHLLPQGRIPALRRAPCLALGAVREGTQGRRRSVPAVGL